MVRWRLWSNSQIYNNQLVGDLPWKMSSNTNETIDQDYYATYFLCVKVSMAFYWGTGPMSYRTSKTLH